MNHTKSTQVLASRLLRPHVLARIAFAAFAGCLSNELCGQEPPVQDESIAIAPDLFQFPRETPEQLIEAATITHSLDRFDDSRAFLRQFIDRQLTENELRDLRRKLGAAPFVDLNTESRLQPEASELLRLINAANQPEPRTDEQMQRLVQQLGQPSMAASEAVSELLAVGDPAVPALLAADPQTRAGRVAMDLLETRTYPFQDGLLSQIASSDASTRTRIIRLLGASANPEISLRLLRWQFDADSDASVKEAAASAFRRLRPSQKLVTTATEAADILTDRARQLITRSGERFHRREESAAVRELTGVNSRGAALAEASVLLEDALAIDPNNELTRHTALVAECAMADTSIALDATTAAGKTLEELLPALDAALSMHHSAASIELLRGLRRLPAGNINSEAAGGVLRKSINSPDARVRLLAANLVRDQLSLKGFESAIQRTLTSISLGSVRPEVVISGAGRVQSGVLRAVFEDAGYTVAEAATGVQGFELAASQMNCELFILDAETWHWPLNTTIANLRADVRTRNTPILVIGPPRFESRVLSISGNYDGVYFIPAPLGAETLQATAQQLTLPDSVEAAIVRRNDRWEQTLQRLELPRLILTPADREAMKQLVRD